METINGTIIDPRNYRATKYASAFTEYLSDLAMTNMERGSGDVECPTGYFVRLGRRIVFADSRGFVWHETYNSEDGASQVFDALDRYYAEWSWEDWDDQETGRIVERDELIRYRDHNGSFHQSCPHCSVMVILFDDDEHWCDDAPIERTESEQLAILAECDAFLAYVVACDAENLSAHDFDMWRVHGKPSGPI